MQMEKPITRTRLRGKDLSRLPEGALPGCTVILLLMMTQLTRKKLIAKKPGIRRFVFRVEHYLHGKLIRKEQLRYLSCSDCMNLIRLETGRKRKVILDTFVYRAKLQRMLI